MKTMEEITTGMMEHICDNLCRHPQEAEDQDELENICAECEMGQYVCDILNHREKEKKDASRSCNK